MKQTVSGRASHSALAAFFCVAAVVAAGPASAGGEPLPSGTSFLTQSLQAQQSDEATNPGMLWISEGALIWQTPDGASGASCATCHGDAGTSMKGVAASYPKVYGKTGELLNLEKRINLCRTSQQNAEPYAYESDPLLALTAFIARQSLGQPINVQIDDASRAFYERGKAMFYRRQGQLNLSCAQCHEALAGKQLRGDTISYGVGNGYPAYRLEWQTLGSLHRRLRSCSYGVRARRFEFGSPEYLSLELFLAVRAQGVPVETPAIRR